MCEDMEGRRVRIMVIPLAVLVQIEKSRSLSYMLLYSDQVIHIPVPLREAYM